MSASSSCPASSMASHSALDAPKSLLRPSSHRLTRQSMQSIGGGGGGGEGAMNLKDMVPGKRAARQKRGFGAQGKSQRTKVYQPFDCSFY